MKKILLISVVVPFLPVFVFAHGGPMMDFDELQTGPEMMEYLEEGTLGDDVHEEMEQLMVRMMSGKMTEDEGVRISEMMDKYPGPYGMMMNRLSRGGSSWQMMSGWNSMMGWGIVWLWVFILSGFVWLAAGILLFVWLFKKIFSKA
ncbi:MAG: hypothetical protein A3J46_01280 [Candidatus Yanofskybacteria bacterium RIFCSPHIGHO2_02_FULL_41_11]|uniref:Uncharacterized protein n=1 Tax=Candidatus Yanofskybacteria bacterium RIFCSPHIGHO2_02_FULL_41_11 TaxID=1802675 RepID=A0A1F8FA09_9BACT|nr:MAG: hypothetical protein A3J46_01280 [Candidatus Yanofskybacteria bacterium RIFCSPHIGHO2_02_FULL_41_11]